MFWDGFIALAAIGLVLAGWTIGFINSWRSFPAVVIACVVTQQYYIDFATWIVQQTLIKPEFAVFLAYLMMWLAIEISSELILNVFLTWGRKERPRIFDRLGGAVLAIGKWGLICTLPLMAMQSPTKVPEPPAKSDGLINPLDSGFDQSALIMFFARTAKNMTPGLGSLVISRKEPSFKPDFSKPLDFDAPAGDDKDNDSQTSG